jgi:hypothetical protein
MTTKPKLVPELRFPGFAVNFAKAKVGDIAKVTSGATPSRQKAKYWDGNIPWVQNSLSDLVFVEEMSNFKSPGCWSFLELCDAVRLLKCR